MKALFVAALGGLFVLTTVPARADDYDNACVGVAGDLVLAARTPQVDLYDGPMGKRVMTMDGDRFPACAPIVGRAPNMMLEVSVGGAMYWVPPHMVRYRLTGNLPAVCRNLAMGKNDAKVGATRGLGEGCPKPGAR
jgi:hypothetical protein